MAVQSEVLERSALLSCCVNPTNTGTAPKGFNTENTAAKM